MTNINNLLEKVRKKYDGKWNDILYVTRTCVNTTNLFSRGDHLLSALNQTKKYRLQEIVSIFSRNGDSVMANLLFQEHNRTKDIRVLVKDCFGQTVITLEGSDFYKEKDSEWGYDALKKAYDTYKDHVRRCIPYVSRDYIYKYNIDTDKLTTLDNHLIQWDERMRWVMSSNNVFELRRKYSNKRDISVIKQKRL